MGILIIVESPAKAKTISKIVGNDYIVKASVGHIRRISDLKKTKDGKTLEINGIDIENSFKPIFEVDPDKQKVVKELKSLAKDREILLATDEDREGEAISWHLAEVLKIPIKNIKRMVFHEITKKAILEAVNNPRELNQNLVNAQQARQVLDKLVGYKLSPVLWTAMNNRHLSAGRVQSPALKLICDREREIQNFVTQEYWEIFGQFNTNEEIQTKFILAVEKTDIRKKLETENYLKMVASLGVKLPKVIDSKEKVEVIIQTLPQNPVFIVQKTTNSQEKTYPKPPFTTSTLQQTASSKLGFNPRQTMSVAQQLYEGISVNGQLTGLITYMRTDSVNLASEAVSKIRDLISKKFPKFLPQKSLFYKGKTRNAQEAHEAIRPTDINLTPASLKDQLQPNQYRLYDLIWKRAVACQMTPEIRERYTFELENVVKDKFQGSVSWTLELGFSAVFEAKVIPKPNFSLNKGDSLNLSEIVSLQNFTKPPSRYSPASLIKKLEELGIGRPSTYASIISTLMDRKYVEDNSKTLIPSFLGMKVCEVLEDNFGLVVSSELTAELEEKLDKIASGQPVYEESLNEFWTYLKKQVAEKEPNIKENIDKYRGVQTEVADPKTGDFMVLKFGKFGEYYQNPNQLENIYPKDFREQEEKLAKIKAELGDSLDDIVCPECSAKMELKAGRFGEYFQCEKEKKHQFPKNFKEYNLTLKEAREQFSDQLNDKKCEVCSKDLIIRVSKASLKPYIACPEYKVGNKHTVSNIEYGDCPQCQKQKRKGKLRLKNIKGVEYYICSLPKKDCGYTQKVEKV